MTDCTHAYNNVFQILRAFLSAEDAAKMADMIASTSMNDNEFTVAAIAKVLAEYIPNLDACKKIALRVSRSWHASMYGRYSRIAAWEYLLESGMSRAEASAYLSRRENAAA